ncbi:hypothetical protein [Ancylomarina sp.]|uniref:hypothetical protein n=1 Tax=Ancylomarina sp. TaxID=1970196 RepID=UPI003564ADDB
MKKCILLIPIFLLFALIGCDKDEIQDINTDVNTLQDSITVIIDQHNALLDSISKLIIMMDNDKFDIKAFQMEQIGSLFEAMARQPEASDMLVSSTEMLYTNYTELLPISDKYIYQRGKGRGIAFSKLFESIARQPEAYDKLELAAGKFLGEYNSSYISDELLEITKAYAMSSLNGSIARQPEARPSFNLVCKKYLNFEVRDDTSK